jgi:hypothetical protein
MDDAMLYTNTAEAVQAVAALGLDVDEAVQQGQIDAPIYLLDQAGAGFGYRYRWEAYGPFSEDLASELTELSVDDVEADSELDEHVRNAVARVRPLLEVPPTLGDLQTYTWLRLLASVHFLQNSSRLEVTNGHTPPFVARNFEDQAVEAAKETLRSLDS